MKTPLMCPSCGVPDRLETVEMVRGFAPLLGVVRSSDGTTDAEWEGATNMDWDSSTSVAVFCNECSWEYHGKDWANHLAQVPTVVRQIEAVLADVDARKAGTGQSPTGAGTDDAKRVVQALVQTAATPSHADARAVLLAELIGAVGKFPEGIEDLYGSVLEHLPTATSALLN